MWFYRSIQRLELSEHMINDGELMENLYINEHLSYSQEL